MARSIVLGDEGPVVKRTKTNRDRRIALDAGTVAALDRHRKMIQERADACGVTVDEDGFLFTLDVQGRTPWRPDSSATGRFTKLRHELGLDRIRLHDLRHYVATELLGAGVPLRSVSERLGHASATTTLAIYAAAVPATDRAAAGIMGGLLEPDAEHGTGKPRWTRDG